MSERNTRNRKQQLKARRLTKSQNQKVNIVSLMNFILPIITMLIVIWLGFHFSSSESSAQSSSIDQSRSTVKALDNNIAEPALVKAKIYFPETSYDFGTVAQNSNVSHTFVVKNLGDAPLKLIKAKGS